MKSLGIILLIAGFIIASVTGIDLVTKKKVVDVGKIEVTKDVDHKMNWPPIAGVVVMIIGGGVYAYGIKKN